MHEQIGIWLRTLHTADTPHEPGHGSKHFELMHARSLWQSACIVHSGRQLGGLPINEGKHEQDGEFPISRHSEFGPQGDGTHGFLTSGTGSSRKK